MSTTTTSYVRDPWSIDRWFSHHDRTGADNRHRHNRRHACLALVALLERLEPAPEASDRSWRGDGA